MVLFSRRFKVADSSQYNRPNIGSVSEQRISCIHNIVFILDNCACNLRNGSSWGETYSSTLNDIASGYAVINHPIDVMCDTTSVEVVLSVKLGWQQDYGLQRIIDTYSWSSHNNLDVTLWRPQKSLYMLMSLNDTLSFISLYPIGYC